MGVEQDIEIETNLSVSRCLNERKLSNTNQRQISILRDSIYN